MIADGERLKALLEKAERRVVLCSPFIKARVIRTVLSVVSPTVPVRIVTRWRAPEIALGISDLEVLDVATERPNTELRLLDDLHAKLYLADEQCLIGSANLTASALGWAERSNIELLILAKPADANIAFLLERLETAELATATNRSEIEEMVAALKVLKLEDGQDMTGESDVRRLAWLPRCAAPDKLYGIYQNSETADVVEGTMEDGLADLRDLQIRPGLSAEDFKISVRNTLCFMSAVAQIIDDVPQGLTDVDGSARIEESRPDLIGPDAQEQWRIVRDWLGVFFKDKFEVAPASFITRLKPRQ